MQLTIHGNRNLIARKLEDSDIPKLIEFCDKCKELGIENNKDLASMKLDKMHMPYGQFFIVLNPEGDIVSVAGVHKFPEVSENAYRCLFRGAQLPGYAPAFSMNFFNSGIHFSYLLYMQIQFIQEFDKNAEFYISTNKNSDTGACSARMNAIMMPRIEKLGIWRLFRKDTILYNTLQNIWKVNVLQYMYLREQWIQQQSNLVLTDTIRSYTQAPG
jgi:hypothetical protein